MTRQVSSAGGMQGVLRSAYRYGFNFVSRYGLSRYLPLKFIKRFTIGRLIKYTLVDGHRMYLDERDSLKLLVNGSYELFKTDLVKKHVRPGDIVVDVGANIGYYTLLFAKLVGENGKVYAFEPDPTNFRLLQKNVQVNGYNNVVLVQKAVSSKTDRAKLFLSATNKGDHRMYDSNDGRPAVEIETVSLNDFFCADMKVDFIKMDIQGAEGGALQGMFSVLRENQDLRLISEFWPGGLKRFGTEPIEYLKLLADMKFRIYVIKEKGRQLQSANVDELLKAYTPERDNYTYLWCTRTG